MVNKFAGKCFYCGGHVPANGGKLWKSGRRWRVAHLTCAKEKRPNVVSFHFPSTGQTVYQNARGRCEDAPCCGCCS